MFRVVKFTPGFAAIVVLTLALGIAGTTVMIALIQGVLLRPLPVRDQDRLILAWKEARTEGSARYPFGNTEIERVAENSTLLEAAAGVTRNGVGRDVVTDNAVSQYANVGLVTGGFFDVLGARALLGRTFTPADEKDGAERVLVISRGLWQRQYGGARDVVGRRVTLDEQPFTIVGVMPPDIDYPSGVEIWRLTSSVPTNGPFGDAARREVNLVGRLRPGATLEQATSEITALSQRIDAETPATGMRGLVPAVRPFVDVVVGDVRLAMLALFGAVTLVLLIASANAANMLLMRGEGRRGELALRVALGAGRGRIVRQVFVESLVLSLLAGIAGIGVAWSSLQALITLVPDGLPRVESVRIDLTVVLFSIAVVFVTALLAGLLPALLSMRMDLVSSLRGDALGIISGVSIRGRRTLVVAQVALAVAVLAAAGLLVRTVLRLQAIDLGLAADRLVLLDLYTPGTKYDDRNQREQFLDQVITQLEAVPAIAAVTPVNVPPFTGRGWDAPRFTAEGQSADEAAANPSLNIESIHPNYFRTTEVAILRGRAFTAADRESSVQVAIVSQEIAARLWPHDNPVGKRIKLGGVNSTASWWEIVGVAAQTRYRAVTSPPPTVYFPAAQFQMTAPMLIVRSRAALELLTSLANDRIRSVDPDVRVMRVAPFSEMLDRPLARPRFNAFLLAVFAGAALLLSTVGLYAVMAAYVRQRRREIALRLALGANAADVRRFVLTEAVRLAGLGAAAGVVVAVMTTRALSGMLFEIDPLDPLTIAGAAVLLIAAAALAAYVPVRRAVRTDAVAVLRSQ